MRALTIIMPLLLCLMSAIPCRGQDVSTDNLTGRTTEHADTTRCIQWGRLLVDCAAGSVINFGATALLKNTVHEMRPNRENNQSFPSRHATLAWGWGSRIAYRFTYRNIWWAPSIHLMASAISQQRIMARQHYAGDVVAGQLMGVGSALFSNWFSNLVFAKINYYPARLTLHPSSRASFMLSTQGLIAFGWNGSHGDRQVRESMSGYGTYLTANLPVTELLSVNAVAGMSSYQPADYSDHAYICPLNAIDVMAGVTASAIVGPKPVECYGSLSAGWRHFVCDVPNVENTFIAKLSGGFNVYFMDRLAIGPALSLHSYRFTCYDNAANQLGLVELSISFNTRVHF